MQENYVCGIVNECGRMWAKHIARAFTGSALHNPSRKHNSVYEYYTLTLGVPQGSIVGQPLFISIVLIASDKCPVTQRSSTLNLTVTYYPIRWIINAEPRTILKELNSHTTSPTLTTKKKAFKSMYIALFCHKVLEFSYCTYFSKRFIFCLLICCSQIKTCNLLS